MPSGVSCACYLVTAYVWSAYVLDQGMRSVARSLVGVLVVVGGLVLVVAASAGLESSSAEPREDAAKPLVAGKAPREAAPRRYGVGLLAAAAVGCIGGSGLAPEEFARSAAQGVDYIPSYAAGAVLCSGLVALLRHGRAVVAPSAAILPGAACGVIYGGSVCCTIEAIVTLDYSVASTLAQCSMLVTAFWGIAVYDELGGDARRLAIFCAGALVIVCGAAVVSYYGTTT